jgi:hypothetical protein
MTAPIHGGRPLRIWLPKQPKEPPAIETAGADLKGTPGDLPRDLTWSRCPRSLGRLFSFPRRNEPGAWQARDGPCAAVFRELKQVTDGEKEAIDDQLSR